MQILNRIWIQALAQDEQNKPKQDDKNRKEYSGKLKYCVHGLNAAGKIYADFDQQWHIKYNCSHNLEKKIIYKKMRGAWNALIGMTTKHPPQ